MSSRGEKELDVLTCPTVVETGFYSVTDFKLK
jgi:hypothetical protein